METAALMEAVSTDISRRVDDDTNQGPATVRGGCWGRDTNDKHSGR